MSWLFIYGFIVQIVLTMNETPPNTEEDDSISRSVASDEDTFDLTQLDHDISAVYKTPNPLEKKALLDNLHEYLKVLRMYNQMTRKGCPETSEKASRLVHSGGPRFLKTHMFYSDTEKLFRHEMTFSDMEFQDYQFYRLDTENEWSELKDQIAHLDRDKEKQMAVTRIF